MQHIQTQAELREIYAQADGLAVKKVLSALELHSIRFIELSPFVVISTQSADGKADISPRGGGAGFVKVASAKCVHIPDWSGNNRLDSMENLIANSAIGLLFLIPGVKDTLRMNGQARILIGEDVLAPHAQNGKLPISVIEVEIEELFLHCPKALMRSKLWDVDTHVDRGALPSLKQMIKDQIGEAGEEESQSDMEARYQKILY